MAKLAKGCKIYYENGGKSREIHGQWKEDGSPDDGEFMEIYFDKDENITKKITKTQINGKLNGEFIAQEFIKSGNDKEMKEIKRISCSYNDDNPADGAYDLFYEKSGWTIKEHSLWKNGLREGLCAITKVESDGSYIIEKTTWKDGVLQGVFTPYLLESYKNDGCCIDSFANFATKTYTLKGNAFTTFEDIDLENIVT